MSRSLVILLSLFSFAAFAGMPTDLRRDDMPTLMAMGPDPGGHTGAGVTPETTKTDRPEVDAARKAASGSKVENNTPADPAQSVKSGATGKPAN